MFGRKSNKFKRPRKMYDAVRIAAENQLLTKYGLKSKREIWKAAAQIDKIRGLAKEAITASQEEQEKLFNRLNKMGLNVKSIADALALTVEDWLKRRLQSILVEKKMATTPGQARQLIVHKHVSINGKKVNIPSYIVESDEEHSLTMNLVIKLKKEKEKHSEMEKQLEELNSEVAEGAVEVVENV